MTKSDDKWAFDKHISVLSPCFERVADAIKIRYGAVTQQLPHNSVPTQLSSIIEAAFAASLRNEEQLPVQFQLICGDPNHFVRWGQQEAGHDNDWDFGFLPDVDLSPEVIRKLSAGLDYETSAILVCDGGSKPVIKGIVRFKKTGIAREPHRLNDVFTTERAIRITATNPGRLVFDNCEMILGELTDGVLTFPQGVEIFSRNFGVFKDTILGYADAAYAALPENLQASKNPHSRREWSDLYNSTLQVIVHAMRRTQRGGTLIITCSNEFRRHVDYVGHEFHSWPDSGMPGMPTVAMRMQHYFRAFQEASDIELRKEYSGDPGEKALFFARGTIEKVFHEHAELMRAARFVGRLTAADGAVILGPDLRVLLMGAKLKTGPPPKCRHITSSAALRLMNREIEQPELEEYVNPRGTRFKSAASFAISDDQSLVFLASADGPVAILQGSNSEVLIGEPLSFAPITLW